MKKPLTKKWWFWLLAIIFFPVTCLFGIYKTIITYKRTNHKRWLIAIVPLALISFSGFITYAGAIAGPNNSSTQNSKISSSKNVPSSKFSSTKETSSSKSSSSSSSTKPSLSSSVQTLSTNDVLKRLIEYTNAKSPGPTQNYYWENGSAKLSGFESMKSGDFHFTSDPMGRSSIARAVLTYSQYKDSKGSRQGSPLDPPAWPSSNPKMAISFSLTGKTYHGYLYNRSHSIADSLLGKGSYSSPYNFTTGTRSQNVGANQNGGMRYAEELAENYWNSNPGTSTTISYQTTPIYNSSEKIPRGSLVDIKSSDGILNTEIVVINDAEGIIIDYNNGTDLPSVQKAPAPSSTQPSSTTIPSSKAVAVTPTPAPSASSVAPVTDNSYTTSAGWSVAANGMVFVSDSGKYYSRVTNPGNYQYITRASADGQGYQQAARGNQYARP